MKTAYFATFIVLVGVTISLFGCCHCKQGSVLAKDSLQIKVTERIEIKRMSYDIHIPQSHQSQTVNKKRSFLENDVAESLAEINDDGSLTHSLNTKLSFTVDIDVPTMHKDSVVMFQSYREVTVEVDSPDSWWEKTQKIGFWAMLAIVLLKYLIRRVSRGGLF